MSDSLSFAGRTPRRASHLLGQYLRPHRRRMLALVATLAATIAVQIASPLLAARFIDRASAGDTLRVLVTIALATMALAVLGSLISITETWIAEQVSWDATNALRGDLAAHLLRLDFGYHTSHPVGELIERVDGDVGTLARFFSRFIIYVVGNAILGIIALLFAVDWRVGAGMSSFVLVSVGIMLWIRRTATPHWAAERQTTADVYGFLSEYLSGLEDIRSSGARPFVVRRFAEMMRTWLRVNVRAQMRGYSLVASSELMFGLGAAFAYAISAWLYRDGALTIGTAYLVFSYTLMLRAPTNQIREEIQDFQQADASLGRIETLFRQQPAITDGPAPALPPGPLEIAFDRVSFAYVDGNPVLHELSFTVPAGRVLGVLGRTGSGKTTLTRLLPRFLDPTSGAVRFGGVDIREVTLAGVRARIGMVTQDVHTFAATVRDNLTLFDPAIPDHRLLAVIDSIGMTDWLAALPHGLDTRLGAGETGLSAGESQVLACARVLLGDPDIVILDEASSRLDPATERLVHRAMGQLLQGRTGIIVAHRLSTFVYADDLLVLDHGRIIEHGPRETLMNDPASHFARLLRQAETELEVLA